MTTAEQLHDRGYATGQSSLLTNMLAVKFGALDNDTHDRVAHATQEQITLWGVPDSFRVPKRSTTSSAADTNGRHHPPAPAHHNCARTAGEVFDLIEFRQQPVDVCRGSRRRARAEREVADPSALVDHSDTTSKQGELIRDGARTSRTGIAMTTAEQLHLAGRASLLTSMPHRQPPAPSTATPDAVSHTPPGSRSVWASRLAQDAATLDDIFDG